MSVPVTRLLTAADLAFEPDDNLRRELHDGVLAVFPPTSPDHAWQVGACYRALSENEPNDVYALQKLGVHVGAHQFYVPDLVAFHRDAAFHDYGYDPARVLLVVEVVSEATVTLDRVTKPAVYAGHGIPYFWRVDEGPTLQSYRLDPRTGRYDDVVEIGPGEAGEPLAPWPVRIDTTELVMPHKRKRGFPRSFFDPRARVGPVLC